jgi:hypothetical protein
MQARRIAVQLTKTPTRARDASAVAGAARSASRHSRTCLCCSSASTAAGTAGEAGESRECGPAAHASASQAVLWCSAASAAGWARRPGCGVESVNKFVIGAVCVFGEDSKRLFNRYRYCIMTEASSACTTPPPHSRPPPPLAHL